ncbi:GNAT family N-acetyltransferase [Nonomuraea africana]|uniref:GNAT superfamily N-acetyltransferase n=1 Tax=Nonomuraea africana TaxID=46171 RepID=A0ABR9KCI3_9ACTN|nr:GNAT family N-acetyltransferase [Nonomuraea africana]MBE1559423.1 GNAT superfamily N-acetyltransferase [Nonomuraea africana]
MTTYRAATPADEAGLHALWAASFTAPHLLPLYESDPGRLPRTLVAAGADGVEAVVYWLPRRLRNADGGVDLVGGVANVATRPDARRRGHIRSLLALAIADMSAAGCDWSLLFTGSPGVYESSGFKVFSQSLTRGTLAAATRPSASAVRQASAAEWPLLAELYDRHNARRPLTTVRTADDWRHRVPAYYNDSIDLRLVEGSGYVVLRWSPDSVELLEAAGELSELLPWVAAEAAARGVTQGRARLTPGEPALPLLFAEYETVADTSGMARPLAVDPSATLTAPSAIHWGADYF